MKKTTFFFIAMLITLYSSAQCIRPTAFGSAVSNNSGVFQTVTTCAYSTEEYSVVSSLIVGGNYTFTAQTGATAGAGPHIYLTVTNASNVVIQHGPSPLTINAITVGTVRLHYSENAACLGEAACKNSQVKYLTDCIPPSALTSSNVTTTTATIGWTAPSTLPGDGYEYYVSTTNTAPTATTTPTGAVAAGTLTANLASLPSATLHYFWVRSKCGANASVWTSSATFTTQCTAFIPSYTQNFATFLPSCWSVSGAGTPATGPTGAGAGIWAADGFLNSGSSGATKVNLYYMNNIGWLISPVIDLSAGGYRVKFDFGATAWGATTATTMGSDDYVAFLVSNDNGTTWTTLHTFNASNTPSNALNTLSIPLTTYTNANTKFAFYATDGTVDDTQDYDFFIDNFVVETIPACEAPVVTASAITSTSATITWPAITGSAGYEYVIDNVATAPTAAGTAQTAATYTTNSLTAQTVYYAHVRTNCGGTFSNWTTISFSTRPANDECAGAIALTVGTAYGTNLTDGTNAGASSSSQATPATCFGYSGGDIWYSIVVPASGNLTVETGNSSTGATGFDSVVTVYSGTCAALTQVGCDDDGADTGSYSKVVLTNQTPGATLYARVYEYNNDVVGSFGISAYANALGTDSFEFSKLSAYPNPVKNVLNLSYSQDISDVAVFNLLGQQVLAKKVNAAESQIDMSNLTQGTYLVKVTVENQVKTIKVIKE
ncbi:T9SS type A sorting domain-containing protein [Flavobacterium qiangtangense]|uniref:T9SS type A sorting domain-containing protein n=1 Tax=Flavobacterium qiangtangense TaxID=1442595 RepID=A0ABW1PI28_9FLAO